MRNSIVFLRRALILPLLLLLPVLILSACSQPKQPPMPLGDLKLGLAFFTQPATTADLLAGYMTEDTPRVEQKVLGELDILFTEVLSKNARHTFSGQELLVDCAKAVHRNTPRAAALRKWSQTGRCMKVDLLVVPQLLDLRERDGGDLGVVTPAKVVMDIYVVDVQGETLISRSRYDETQSSLSDNLLETGKFLHRGGKWVQATDLAVEGMEKAIKELGL